MKISARLAAVVGVGVGALALVACGSSSGNSTSTTGGGGSTGTTVEMCDEASTAVSAGNVTITFPTSAAPAQYSPNCVKVHKGAMVTWSGAFADHPLAPDDATGPITATMGGTTATFTMGTEGAFGFHCNFHPTIMHGAVFVVP